ncbi:MAG TPA: zinc-binding dehydrogenase [Nocardioides sp.]|uniref:zinc-binding dehydrogenase n=1 Tax=Nocardioides sp. TaxID=35761 RepID=UPI002D18E905|nr:zinc-binding dehydrogenase [Nocardioides sp.]HTW17106.1 zinc-binding dehydrogenase [Nocardioides sp.]
MRAVMHTEFGDPTQVLAVEEVESPEPGPGEVRIRILLAAVHNHDLWTIRGSYGFKPELPARAGTEAVGVVEALGAGVEHLTIGQRVASGGAFGAWAEQLVVPARGLIPVPDQLTDEVAAQLVSMPFSAISLLESLELTPGDWMVQNAANGAVGRMVAQLAQARGINVIGLVRRGAGVEELASQGIGNVVATDADDWAGRVRALADDAPIKVGVDSVGGRASGEVMSLLAEDGTLVVFGAMQSPVMEIGSGDVIFKQATIRGFWGSVVSRTMPADQRRALFGELVERIGDGSLTLPVERVYPLEDVRAAAAANAEPGRTGKILLRP